MSIDRTVFIDNYIEELKENITVINSSIIKLKKDITNNGELNILKRSLHTIKGSSRMLKFSEIEKVSHGLESVINGIDDGRYGVDDNLVKLVFITTDIFNMGIELIEEHKDDSKLEVEKILKVFIKASACEPYALENILEEKSEETIDSGEKLDDKSIRIKVERINKIIKLTNSLVIRPLKLKKEIESLELLEKKIKKVSSTYKDNEELTDSLNIVNIIKKNLKNEFASLERESVNIKDDLLKLRMLPIGVILSPMQKMVEDIAISLGKEINFKIIGKNILVDKFLLEKLKDPILHIVRNALDHGIELPKEREINGKKRVGTINIRCSSNNGNVTIFIEDDGCGINYPKLRERAKLKFPEDVDSIDSLVDSQLNSYLFKSGFSTKESISDVSGRGIGLEIVRYNIENMKGKISIDTEKSNGTKFILSLPHSIGSIDGFFIKSGDDKYLVPSNFVLKVILLKEADKHSVLNKKLIDYEGKLVPIFYLSDLFKDSLDRNDNKEFVIIVESRGEILGITVDSLVEYTSLVYKPLPLSLKGTKGLQGVVFDDRFNLIPIISIPEIIDKLKIVCNIDLKPRFSSDVKRYKKILVVDDSFSTREIERSILTSENYSVDVANDGIDGLDMAKKRSYNLIVTDVNMPRMDGYTMVENLRKNVLYKDIPIIVVTSNKKDELVDKFNRLGVDSVIIKSDFERGNLVDEVKRLI